MVTNTIESTARQLHNVQKRSRRLSLKRTNPRFDHRLGRAAQDHPESSRRTTGASLAIKTPQHRMMMGSSTRHRQFESYVRRGCPVGIPRKDLDLYRRVIPAICLSEATFPLNFNIPLQHAILPAQQVGESRVGIHVEKKIMRVVSPGRYLQTPRPPEFLRPERTPADTVNHQVLTDRTPHKMESVVLSLMFVLCLSLVLAYFHVERTSSNR